MNRLNAATLAAGQTQGYQYDANGNRTSATINAATTTYTYPTTSHRLTSLSGATTRSFTYDNAGNTTVTAGITMVYDGRGRMKSAGTTNYLVNGLGQRVKKATGVVETFFAYDEAGHLIGEYDTTGGAIQETVWLGDLPVAVMKPATPTAVFYIWADNLGTPRMISDAANQARWEWANSDPFGNNLPNENPAGVGIFTYNLRFPGQYYDGETGRYYNYFRDFDPSTGRYLESDPIGLVGGLNTYGYVRANPLGFTDPEGLQIVVPPGPLGGAGGAAAGGSWWGSQGANGSTGYGSSGGWGQWGSWGGSDSWGGSGKGASASSCPPPDRDPCKGLREQLKAHEKKLQDYMRDPPSHDNLGLLGQGFDHVIIPGRIRSLQKQIDNFRTQLQECEAKNAK